MAKAKRTDDAWMAELLGGSAIIWKGAPDPAAYAAGEKRAARPRLGLAIALCAVSAALVATWVIWFFLLPAPGGWKDVVDAVVVAVRGSVNLLFWVVPAILVVSGVLATRRWIQRNTGRTTYVLTADDLVIYDVRGAERFELDSVVAVEWRPGKYGSARGDVIARIRATGEDEQSNPFGIGMAVTLHGVRDPERVCGLVRAACDERRRGMKVGDGG